MLNKSGYKAGRANLRSLLDKVTLKVFAEDGEGATEPSKEDSPQINFETLIASARKEEKAKLYPRITKLEDENKILVQTNNQNLVKLAKSEEELTKLKDSKGESEEITGYKTKVTALEKEIEDLKKTTPDEKAIREAIEKEYEVKLYRSEKLTEKKEDILPMFEDIVKGLTKEEIDTTLTDALKKTLDVKKQLGLIDEAGNVILPTNKKEKEDKKKPPVANPGAGQTKTFDLNYVESLDPRSKEYAEWRKKQGLR